MAKSTEQMVVFETALYPALYLVAGGKSFKARGGELLVDEAEAEAVREWARVHKHMGLTEDGTREVDILEPVPLGNLATGGSPAGPTATMAMKKPELVQMAIDRGSTRATAESMLKHQLVAMLSGEEKQRVDDGTEAPPTTGEALGSDSGAPDAGPDRDKAPGEPGGIAEEATGDTAGGAGGDTDEAGEDDEE